MNEIVILGFSVPKIMPDKVEGREIWSLNIGYQLPWMDMTRIDRWFDMHRREKLETDKHASYHIPWLKEKHHFPIYMIRKWDDFPASEPYPLDDVCDTLLRTRIVRMEPLGDYTQWYYFSCSFAYMLALAIYEKPKAITLMGVEMLAPREVYMEAPGVEFWLGQAVARDIYVRVPDESRLLWRHEYGYEKRLPPAWLPESVAREVYFDSQRMEWELSIPSFYNYLYERKSIAPDKDYREADSTDSGGVKDVRGL